MSRYDGLTRFLARRYPGSELLALRPLGVDEAGEGAAHKEVGYGEVVRVDLRAADGAAIELVFHTAKPNDFGHDRRSDRAAEVLLAWDTFSLLPRHVRAVDVGAVRPGGELVSLADAGELWLLTEYRDGAPYAHDLREIAARGALEPRDLERARALGRYLAEVHEAPGTHPEAYTRAIRDLAGSGECVAGLADAYPVEGVPGAPAARLEAIERAVLEWRFRLRRRTSRLRRTHGDFHPFNVLFGPGGLVALDASRGAEGDPADDLASLSINYLFFGLGVPREVYPETFGALFTAFFGAYAERRDDPGLLEVLAPFYAFRALVLASPLWYPDLAASGRERLLSFVERALAAERFDLAWGAEAP